MINDISHLGSKLKPKKNVNKKFTEKINKY